MKGEVNGMRSRRTFAYLEYFDWFQVKL